MLLRIAIPWALLVLLVVNVAVVSAGPLKVGDRFPNLVLPNLAGEKVAIEQETPGKILIVHFWWTKCIFCRNELLALNDIHAQEVGRKVLPLSINVGDNRRAIDGFLYGINPSFPILLDDEGAAAKKYGVIGIPTTFILDRQGIIRHKIVGEINAAGLAKLLTAIE